MRHQKSVRCQFVALKMSTFVPEKDVLRGSLTAFFQLKETAVESYRLLVEAYGEHTLIEKNCEQQVSTL